MHIPLYKLSSHIIIVFSRCARPPPLPTLNCFCCSDRFLLFLFSLSPFLFAFPFFLPSSKKTACTLRRLFLLDSTNYPSSVALFFF